MTGTQTQPSNSWCWEDDARMNAKTLEVPGVYRGTINLRWEWKVTAHPKDAECFNNDVFWL